MKLLLFFQLITLVSHVSVASVECERDASLRIKDGSSNITSKGYMIDDIYGAGPSVTSGRSYLLDVNISYSFCSDRLDAANAYEIIFNEANTDLKVEYFREYEISGYLVKSLEPIKSQNPRFAFIKKSSTSHLDFIVSLVPSSYTQMAEIIFCKDSETLTQSFDSCSGKVVSISYLRIFESILKPEEFRTLKGDVGMMKSSEAKTYKRSFQS